MYEIMQKNAKRNERSKVGNNDTPDNITFDYEGKII